MGKPERLLLVVLGYWVCLPSVSYYRFSAFWLLMPTSPVTTSEILVYNLTIILIFTYARIRWYTESIHYSMYSSLVALASLGYATVLLWVNMYLYKIVTSASILFGKISYKMVYALTVVKTIYLVFLNKKFFYPSGSCKSVGACLPFILG